MHYKTIKTKNIFVLLAVLVGLPLLFMAGCKSVVKTIYNSMDCDQFNIDHIELRTGIDIPKVTRNFCHLDDTSRSISFEVLLDPAGLSAYSAKYFEWDSTLFKAKGQRRDTKWNASLDTSTSVLIFNLFYIEDVKS